MQTVREWTSICGPGSSDNVHSKCGTVLSRCTADGGLLLDMISASSIFFAALAGRADAKGWSLAKRSGRAGVSARQQFCRQDQLRRRMELLHGQLAALMAALLWWCGCQQFCGCAALVGILPLNELSWSLRVLQTGRGLSPRPQIGNQGRGLQGCRAWMHLWALVFSV